MSLQLHVGHSLEYDIGFAPSSASEEDKALREFELVGGIEDICRRSRFWGGIFG
jgi:hypothetical protein